MKKSMIITMAVLFSFKVHSQIKLKPIEYQQGDTQLLGTLYYDPILKSKRGGILLVHDVEGQIDFIKQNAQSLATAGYIVFVADLFGKDVKEKDDVVKSLQEDRTLLLERTRVALDILKEQSSVDPLRLASIGYGLGGTAVLDLARSGAQTRATACFYGNLATVTPAQPLSIQGIVLIYLGNNDPNIPPEEITAFKEEMNNADVDWQINLYGKAVHGFANPEAGDDVASGTAYYYHAERRSMESLKAILFMLLK